MILTNPTRQIRVKTLLLSLFAACAPVLSQAQTTYAFHTLFSTTYTSANGAGDQVLSPAINNAGDVLWAGQTQAGARIFLNSPGNNIAAQAANANTLIDSRLPRFGSSSQNAVWNALSGEINPVTKLSQPNSNYQEDRIYLYNPSLSATPAIIGRTQFAANLGTVTSPDVNDRGQVVYRRLDYSALRWSLFTNSGSGLESDTQKVLDNYASIATPYLSNSGNVAFFGKAGSADPTRLFFYNIDVNTLNPITLSSPLVNPSLRDFSNDDTALVFDGSNLTGSFYTVNANGVVSLLATAGANGLARLELGQRNGKGQVAFANRTQLSVGGANPNAGLSDVFLYDNGLIRQITSNAPGVSITNLNLNDNGDV